MKTVDQYYKESVIALEICKSHPYCGWIDVIEDALCDCPPKLRRLTAAILVFVRWKFAPEWPVSSILCAACFGGMQKGWWRCGLRSDYDGCPVAYENRRGDRYKGCVHRARSGEVWEDVRREAKKAGVRMK